MFEITDAEKLRDAYTLLAFIRDDVPTQPPPNRSPAWPPLWSASRKISGPTTTARRLTATLSRSTALMATLSWCGSRTSWTRSMRTMPPSGSRQIATMSFAPHPMTVPVSASQTGTSCTAAMGTGSHIIRSALMFNQKGGQNHENQHLQPHF